MAEGAGDFHVALLRGINVGGKNLLPMRSLAALFAEVGCNDVRTYIQSGNVVFRAKDATVRKLPGVVGRAIEERFGLRVPVVVRSAADLARVQRANPFLAKGADPAELHVVFLAEAPAAAAVAALDGKRSPPDELVVLGREIYLRLPNGVARTKLTNDYFDSKLATTSTMRNWRTVLKLVEMCGPAAG